MAKPAALPYHSGMNEELEKLVQQARPGQGDPWQRLVDALREEAGGDPNVLVDFLRSEDDVRIRSAIQVAAMQNQSSPALAAALAATVGHPTPHIRQEIALALSNYPAWPFDDLAGRLLEDVDSNVRSAAVWACKPRPALVSRLIERMHADDVPWIRQDIASILGDVEPALALPALLARLAVDDDTYVQQNCAASLERQFNRAGGVAELARAPGMLNANLGSPSSATLSEVQKRVVTLGATAYPRLSKWLGDRLADFVDYDQLRRWGTVLTEEAERGDLPRGHGVDRAVEDVLKILHGSAPRAAVLLGEAGTGKTAVVNEIVHRLLEGPERGIVLRMSPQDFLVDTKWIGEWETRLRDLIGAIKQPRRVILYVPSIEQLTWVGTTSSSQANVATALAPSIERGDVTILGESSLESFRRGMGANRSLRRLFTSVELQPATHRETRDILDRVVAESGANIDEATIDRLLELADYFVSGAANPGRAVGLFRLVSGMKAEKEPIREQDILGAISRSTGMPLQLLSDTVALDRSGVRGFFEQRVMGQPEAVEAMLDLVTLVKAGLTDPNKPMGVFLFVGPTGVGKTELARALAEHLFGDPTRMIRLDMSEFATYESYERLIGGAYAGAEPGLLTSKVREQPFSVLLLDEIEKAHPNVYNLCLQIFDAGRLTDNQGRTADFRRVIIIMTSNVGAAVPTDTTLGLRPELPKPPDRETILREIGHWFRPEFLNRIDRIVTFLPLARETAEKIAEREVERVLQRSGIARRGLAIDVDPAVFPLLLAEGYSVAFGARPLKRTIERLVLLPVARAIAEGKAPAGSLLRLVARGGRVDIDVEPPETGETPAPEAPRAKPVTERALELLEKARRLSAETKPLAERKTTLLGQTANPAFWDDRRAYRAVQDEIYRLDGILGQVEALEKKVMAEAEVAQRHRHSERDLQRVDQHLDGLASQIEHLSFLAQCRDAPALGDALVSLRLVQRQGGDLDALGRLAQLYIKMGQRRGLEVQVISDRHGDGPREDAITLLCSGAGAYALLAGEGGLHQFSRGRRLKGREALEREIVSVEVLPVPAGDWPTDAKELATEVRPLSGRRGRLLPRVNQEVRLFHAASNLSVRAWCDGGKNEAIERTRLILHARLEAQRRGEPEGETRTVVRRYRLGPTTLVRDFRTGKSTGRLDLVLDGHIDGFLGRGEGERA
ncbi:MAG: AAA family ATPase [Gemmataceae bacterium]